jgi:DUF4097 and DUF4098 domain-containing protein YvlB
VKFNANSRVARLVEIVAVAAIMVPAATMQAQPSEASSGQIVRQGGDWVQETTGTLTGARNLHVKVDMGSVVVRGGGGPEIRYVIHTKSHTSSDRDARKQLESYKVTTYVHGDTAWIMGDWQGRRPRQFSAEVTINVPREIDVAKIETDGGGVDLENISGRVEAESGGGCVRIKDVGGSASVETGGGTVDIGMIGGDIAAHTGGGSIVIRSAKGKIAADTGGGSIEIVSGQQDTSVETGAGSIAVRQCSGKVTAQTGGGSIDIGDVGGGADINTGGGSIRLTSAKGAVRAETGGGGIELYGVPSAIAETGAGGITVKLVNNGGERANSSLATSAGDITVYIASDVGVNVRASIELANGHSIHSDFGEVHVSAEGGQWGPKTITAEGKVNGGGPLLKVRTTTGDINLRRAGR